MSDQLKGFNTNSTSNIKTFSSFNNSTSANSNTYIQNVATNNNSNVETLDLNINASQEQIEQSNNNQSSIDDSTKAVISNAKSVIVDFSSNAYDKVNSVISSISSFITRILKKTSEEDIANLKADPNYFKSIETLSGDYGVNQRLFQEMSYYELNGVKYSYREATQMINEAIKKGETPPVFLQVIPEENKAEYDRMCKKIMKEGYSKQDAELILNMVNYAGACSYASICNEIFQQFSGSPELFKKVFGYDMYITDSRGNKKLNSSELLLDLYMYANDQKNGGKLLNNGKINSECLTDEVDPLGNHTINVGDNQVYFSGIEYYYQDGTMSTFVNEEMIDKFLQSKNPYLNYTPTSYKSFDFSEYKDWINSEIENGTSFNLSYYYHVDDSNQNTVIHMNSDIVDKSLDTTTWGEGGGHSVVVTGATDEGLVISSWGQKYTIPYEDLKPNFNCELKTSKITWNLGDESQ